MNYCSQTELVLALPVSRTEESSGNLANSFLVQKVPDFSTFTVLYLLYCIFYWYFHEIIQHWPTADSLDSFPSSQTVQYSKSDIALKVYLMQYHLKLTFKVLLCRWSSRQSDSSLLRARMALLCSLCRWTFSFTTCACFFCSIFICLWTFRLSSN